MDNAQVYSIPDRFRRTENLHIIFWLIKDLSWCLLWKPLGVLMIVPTIFIAVAITWRTRHILSERYHNLAVTFWIIANSYWMISEFLSFDEMPMTSTLTYRHLSIIPFALGICSIGYYYIFARRSDRNDRLAEVSSDARK